MTNRNPIAVFLLSFITFGIYGIYWYAKNRGEMVALGADVPTTWLIIIPFVNIWYLWKFSQGVAHVSGGKMSGALAFILLWFLSSIGAAIIQVSFNEVGAAQPAQAGAPTPPVMQ